MSFKPRKLVGGYGMPHLLKKSVEKIFNEVESSHISAKTKKAVLCEFTFYLTDKGRGVADFDRKYVEIPSFTFHDHNFYKYYIIHELCHVLCFLEGHVEEVHGENFYRHFVNLCPRELHFYELEYIPTATKYGVG